MSATKRKILLVLLDAVLINLAFVCAYLVRFDFAPGGFLVDYFSMAVVITAIFLGSFYFFGIYKKIWEYASTGELLTIVYSVTAATAASVAYVYFIGAMLPRSIIILGWVFSIVFIGGSRLSWRIFREKYFKPAGDKKKGTPVLIIGAGSAGAMLLRELKRYSRDYKPVGFIDDDLKKQNQELMGVPVLGTRKDVPRVVEKHGVKEIIIAVPSASGSVIREIVREARSTGVKVSILPILGVLEDRGIRLNEIREVSPEDLLRREPVNVNISEISDYIENKTVLITGAGGSIGSELCRQVVEFSPRSVILVGHDENPIFEIEQELKEKFPQDKLVFVIGDIRDREKIDYIFERYMPELVFHAAAHKHVPLMELNPEEAVKNNILGTRNVAEAADKNGCETFILVSTDKAVNPTSVMGASKRIAEMIIQDLGMKSSTRFAAVRFGNVLGSRGSVIPTFKKQIEAGGPVTVTHPEMTRYFMTIPEAVQLIIQAGAMADRGEVFVLDMGEPVKIDEMARDLIAFCGYEPDKDIEIKYTGSRPGEKFFEELLTAEEDTAATRHERIRAAKAGRLDSASLAAVVEELEKLSLSCRREEITAKLIKERRKSL